MSDNNQRREAITKRSELLKRVRDFFHNRGFLEVETPLVSGEVIPELHIEPSIVGELPRGAQFLQASPELHMKRLLCEGFEAIYQVTRSFRGGEQGALHSPEFTIVEWYRTGDGMTEGIALVDRLLGEVAGTRPAVLTSYREAFEREVQLDPHLASCELLAAKARDLQLDVPEEFPHDDRDQWMNLLLSFCIEPKLGQDGPEILCDYPSGQAALAKVEPSSNGISVARRFELYWRGIELANGYDELTDAVELRNRLEQVNTARANDGRPALPLPESLLATMTDPGLPPCSGCALGFDRLAMLACEADSIDRVRAF
ncbi:EF-P lysine aminoacylase EpmA [Adhaeretor mobilis]|uniref:Elongation factor P--(R)-beta-lysine ligase n=1 Tax=Adhaeretor mobilis TaxID=1930276 RepID=A0A517N1P0_9BACT|nr:EF-P lysine aminoacylase EpmA [Adhaeretor mobilis]QDT01054.1 Elongation factor P--(R)-beta-lysine ligase [Adhaeretor mobilis]